MLIGVCLNMDSNMQSQGIRGLVYSIKKSISSKEIWFTNGVFSPYSKKNVECPNSTDEKAPFFINKPGDFRKWITIYLKSRFHRTGHDCLYNTIPALL
jgi:hypothetical protein